MNKLILLALSIGALSNTNNLSTNSDSMYAYGLPYEINDRMQLTIDNTLDVCANNYIPNGTYFNNTMPTPNFIDSLFSAYFNYGSHDNVFINSELSQTYYYVTGTTRESMDISIYGGAIISGYVDSNGAYVDLSFSDNSFIGLELFYLWGGDEYTYNADFNNPNVTQPYVYNFTGDGYFTVDDTHITIQFLRNVKKLYIGGFFAYNPDYSELRTYYNFFLQYALSLMYGEDIKEILNGNQLVLEPFYNDGRFTDYHVDYSLNNFYPYMYLGLNSIDTYYYIQDNGYIVNQDSNKYYGPNFTVMYNGWFKYNNAFYDTLFLRFGRLTGSFTLNNQTFSLSDNQFLYVFSDLFAYNTEVNTLTKVLSSDFTRSDLGEWTVSNNFIIHNNTNVITFYNVYFYGTNFNVDYYYSADIPLYADTVTNTPQYIINNQGTLKPYLINTIGFRNYLDCLNAKPFGAGDNVGNETGSIIDSNTTILTDVFDMYGNALNSLTSFLNFAIFPGITLGLLLLIPLVITLIITIVKLFKR